MVLADFHLHSTYSDGKLSIRQLVDLYGKNGFSAIAITDHLCEKHTALGWFARRLDRTLLEENFYRYLNEIQAEAERAKALYNLTVIPGVEITKNSFSHDNSAHVLGLGISRFIDPDAEIVEILREIKRQGGVTVAAHPVSTRKLEAQTFYLWDNRDWLATEFDAWEVASGRHLFTEVAESGLPMLASSDLHHPHQLTSWKTVVDSQNHPEAIFQAIRQQKIDFRFWQAKQMDFKKLTKGNDYVTATAPTF